MMRARILVALFLAGVACEAGAPAPGAALLTLGGLRTAFLRSPTEPVAAGLSRVFSAGFPPAYFLASKDEIRIAPAFTEGLPSAYITTDIWVNFPKIWAQPLYVFVAPGNPRDPEANLLPLPWIAGVGSASAFWSPYFRITYVEVPRDTPPDRFATVRDVLAARLPMHPGPTRLVTLLPDAAMAPEDPGRSLLPTLQGRIGLPVRRQVIVEGKPAPQAALDFGSDRFVIEAGDVIAEEPLFFFFGRNDAGQSVPLTPVPRVGGTGPIGAGREPVAPGNRPRFGSLWRLWAVHLPASARIFVPRPRRAEWEARSWGAQPNLAIAESSAALDALPGIDSFAFRVLLDEGCLANAATTAALDACPWLDSQERLERHLSHALESSEILVACPFVAYAGAPVPPPSP